MAGGGRERITSTTIGCGNLVFFYIIPCPFSMGMEKKHENHKACTPVNIEMENGSGLKMYFLAKIGIFQPSYVSSPPEALQPTSAVGKNSRGCWHCLSLDASHTSAELLDVWEGCKR